MVGRRPAFKNNALCRFVTGFKVFICGYAKALCSFCINAVFRFAYPPFSFRVAKKRLQHPVISVLKTHVKRYLLFCVVEHEEPVFAEAFFCYYSLILVEFMNMPALGY